MTTPLRRPVSSRHAFALAFDLAVRRDALQSLVVPLLLRAPWIVALSMLPAPGVSGAPGRTLLLWCAAALGDTLAALTVDAMLRVRARSVFRMPLERHPAPALECYARGLARVPWLFATELLRRFAIAFGAMLLLVPGVYFGFRLAFATEAVVLGDPNTSAAFRHSHRLTAGRFERWLELMVLSVGIVLGAWFALAAIMVAVHSSSIETWGSIAYLAAVAVWPILQYAWTFFYLRLIEIEQPLIEVGPLYAEASAEASGTGTVPPIPLTTATADPPVFAPPAFPSPADDGEPEPRPGAAALGQNAPGTTT